MARSYQCWDCGGQVAAEDVQRHEVMRHSVSSGRSPRVHTRRQRVNLCPDCVRKHQRRDMMKGIVGLIAIAVLVLYVLVLR